MQGTLKNWRDRGKHRKWKACRAVGGIYGKELKVAVKYVEMTSDKTP